MKKSMQKLGAKIGLGGRHSSAEWYHSFLLLPWRILANSWKVSQLIGLYCLFQKSPRRLDDAVEVLEVFEMLARAGLILKDRRLTFF